MHNTSNRSFGVKNNCNVEPVSSDAEMPHFPQHGCDLLFYSTPSQMGLFLSAVILVSWWVTWIVSVNSLMQPLLGFLRHYALASTYCRGFCSHMLWSCSQEHAQMFHWTTFLDSPHFPPFMTLSWNSFFLEKDEITCNKAIGIKRKEELVYFSGFCSL